MTDNIPDPGDVVPDPDDPRGRRLHWRPKFARRLLDIDARIDFALFASGKWARERYERFTAAMDRIHVAGWRRWLLVEPLSEMATLGSGFLMLLFALSIPAYRQTVEGDWLKKADLAVTFLDRYGNKVGSRGIKHNDSVPLDQMPDNLIKAVLATEDRRFYEHFGIDFLGTSRAMVTNAQAGGVVQGGSTITQQLAKNLFLTNERTYTRKVNEAFFAGWLEAHLTKNQILKLYLDRMYLGAGVYGVDAAAEYYFGKSVRDLTLAESAMIAGMLKAPVKYSPLVNLPAARARANVVLDNLVATGFLTEGQVYGARRHPATPVMRGEDDVANYYLDWAFDEVRQIVDTFPNSVSERYFVVRTALDTDLQRYADHVVQSNLRDYGHEYGASQAAVVIADLDGAVHAMVGGRDYDESQFNRAVDAMRQPGSSFKPYVYSTAFANGFTPSSVVVDSPVCIGNWCPHNFSGGFSGPVTLLDAITRSINVIPVKLSIALGGGNAKIGRARIVQTARNMGIVTPLPDTPSLPIGADAVTPLEHAVAFATFPNLGKAVAPHAVLDIRNGSGREVWRFDRDGTPPRQVISPHVAVEMIKMMNSVVENGTGRRAALDGVPTCGKTGTTNDFRDGWFVGYTGNFVGSVWMGNDNFSTTKRMEGGSLPAMTWHDIMAFAHQGVELRALPGLPPPQHAPPMAAGAVMAVDQPRQLLTRKANEALVHLQEMLDNAAHGPSAQFGPPARFGALDDGSTVHLIGGSTQASLAATTDQTAPTGAPSD